MARFDHSKPFSRVFGDHPATYYQDGVHYNGQYEPIDVEPDPDEHTDNELLDADEPAADEPAADEPAADEPAADEPAEVNPLADVDFESMPWQHVKRFVEDAGGTWTNKVNGIKFLRGN